MHTIAACIVRRACIRGESEYIRRCRWFGHISAPASALIRLSGSHRAAGSCWHQK